MSKKRVSLNCKRIVGKDTPIESLTKQTIDMLYDIHCESLAYIRYGEYNENNNTANIYIEKYSIYDNQKNRFKKIKNLQDSYKGALILNILNGLSYLEEKGISHTLMMEDILFVKCDCKVLMSVGNDGDYIGVKLLNYWNTLYDKVLSAGKNEAAVSLEGVDGSIKKNIQLLLSIFWNKNEINELKQLIIDQIANNNTYEDIAYYIACQLREKYTLQMAITAGFFNEKSKLKIRRRLIKF